MGAAGEPGGCCWSFLSSGSRRGRGPPRPAPGELFDAHCHYYDFMQESEGAAKLLEAMAAARIACAAVMGNPLKKAHVHGESPPEHELFDDGELYCYSATDYKLSTALAKLPRGQRARLFLCVCGINLSDKSSPGQLLQLLSEVPDVKAVGELVLRGGLKTNMVLRGAGAANKGENARGVLANCSRGATPLPCIVRCNACARRGWADRRKFQYLEELAELADAHPSVPIIWKSAGIFKGGCWDGYDAVLVEFLESHQNVYISITAAILEDTNPVVKRDLLLGVAAQFPERVVLGTQARGWFTTTRDIAWEEMSYQEECSLLHKFADSLAERAGSAVASAVRYGNAAGLFAPTQSSGRTLQRLPSSQHIPEPLQEQGDLDRNAMHAAAHYGSGKGMLSQQALGALAPLPSPRKSPRKAQEQQKAPAAAAPAPRRQWPSVDCHFHLFDFSQKSCGTAAALRALDEACAEKAVLLGIPCCKKWNRGQKECPLFYTDDNGPCYFYSYVDQMLVDAWLAVSDRGRPRLAPLISGFDPTDRNSINHVRRMYDKYPRLWRGLGEVMCRHDDLTSTLMNKEVPVPNHPGMDPIYEFCVEKGLPVVVHSNADRVAHKSTGMLEYACEVEDVLQRFPRLIFVWCHAGVSRQTADEHQADHISDLMSKYPNLNADISWVVWEQSICNAAGEIRESWLRVIEKHSDRFTIGSDNTGQFWTPDLKKNTLSGQITKYWPLYERLSPEAAERVSRGNGNRLFFDGWDVPLSTDRDARYHNGPRCYPCEFLDMVEREYYPGQEVSAQEEDFAF